MISNNIYYKKQQKNHLKYYSGDFFVIAIFDCIAIEIPKILRISIAY